MPCFVCFLSVVTAVTIRRGFCFVGFVGCCFIDYIRREVASKLSDATCVKLKFEVYIEMNNSDVIARKLPRRLT